MEEERSCQCLTNQERRGSISVLLGRVTGIGEASVEDFWVGLGRHTLDVVHQCRAHLEGVAVSDGDAPPAKQEHVF